MPSTEPLSEIFAGWEGHQASLVAAIEPLSPAQLRWRPAENLNSVGELARHISLARIEWFVRMDAPGSAELAAAIHAWEEDRDGNQHIVENAVVSAELAGDLVQWLESTWEMVANTLPAWEVYDLAKTFPYTFNGTAYNVSRQWTIWRILTHDVHHGGQISLMLGMLGIEHFELGDLFGHVTMPAVADPA